MRVSLGRARPRAISGAQAGADDAPRPLLTTSGARIVLAGELGADGVVGAIVPGQATMFAPRGACLASPRGPLFVCDTGHHRLLVWRRIPCADGTPADLLIGQPDFSEEGRNAKGEIGPATLNVPTGVAAADGVLAVADAWNHRVLLWFGYPDVSNRPADVVLGQADFGAGLANRGEAVATATTLNWCYGVTLAADRLLVADTGNRRVLVWNQIPTTNGAPADLVMGQPDFTTRDENAGLPAGPLGMCWPHGVVVHRDAVFVADAGNNRVMVWNNWPGSNGSACDFVLGQPDNASLDHNRAASDPTSEAMSMPYGLAVLRDRLIVADTANSRILGFDCGAPMSGAKASWLAGQRSFTERGDNRWGRPMRDSICWPYSIAACDETLIIADTGNSRVLLWNAAT